MAERKTHETIEESARSVLDWLLDERRFEALARVQLSLDSLRQCWQNTVVGDPLPDLSVDWNFGRPHIDHRKHFEAVLARRLEWSSCRIDFRLRIEDSDVKLRKF